MSNTEIYKKIGLKLVYVFGLSSAGIFAWLNLGEFVTVRIQKNISGYPFGGESPAPWYYESADIFSNFCLLFGTLFSAVLILAIWAIVKGRKAMLVYSALSSIGLILLEILLSNSEP